MSRLALKGIQAAAGNAGGEALYVEDVFSTYLYEGTGSNQTITNNIDLNGEGGLVWLKDRNNTYDHAFYDTERGVYKYLESNQTGAEVSNTTHLRAFNSNGFDIGVNLQINTSGSDYVSWTFRKAPKFFDVVTYTGDGVAGRTVAHNLGSVPGCIIVKKLNAADQWAVQHKSLTATHNLILERTDAATDDDAYWYDIEPTSTEFTVGYDGGTNGNGSSYVAYLFAHNDGDGEFGETGDQDIIKCGSYTGNGTAGRTVDFGFEPQWVLFKRTDTTDDWYLFDSMRELTTDISARLRPNTSDEEGRAFYYIPPNATGITFNASGGGALNTSGGNYIYIAIRRGPMKTPESGTEVFSAALTGTPGGTNFRPENVDMAMFAKRGGDSENFQVADRIRGFQSTSLNADDSYTSPTLETNNSNAEETSATSIHQSNFSSSGPDVRAVSSGSNFLFYRFKRAPGFFDVVAYEGNGTANTQIPHNLSSVPACIIVKNRGNGTPWKVLFNLDSYYDLKLNANDAASSIGYFYWGDAVSEIIAPTDTNFTVGNQMEVNNNGYTHVAYLFATLPGVSKVGSYTGTGADLNVNCGFSAGARFVLIKRTDSTGDWYVWDTERGIVAGNDPYLLLNSTAAEVTSTDYIDPLSSGFTVTSSAPAALNASGGTYIFLAIA